MPDDNKKSRWDYLGKEPETPNADSLYAQGRQLTKEKQYDEAITCFNKVIDIDSNQADAWYWKGVCLNFLKKYNEAIECFTQTIKLFPWDGFAHLDMGIALSELGNHETAIQYFKKAIELEPNLSKNLPADVLQRLTQFEKTKTMDETLKSWLKKGLDLSEERWRLEQIGSSAAADACARQAIICYDQVLSINSNNAEALFWKGVELGVLERFEECIRCFKKAVTINPSLKVNIPKQLQGLVDLYR